VYRRHTDGGCDHRPALDTGSFYHRTYTLLPFGLKAVSRPEYYGTDNVGTGPLGLVGNVIWFVLAGWWLALGHVITAIPLAVTIIGFPFAWAHLKLEGIALWPIGKIIMPASNTLCDSNSIAVWPPYELTGALLQHHSDACHKGSGRRNIAFGSARKPIPSAMLFPAVCSKKFPHRNRDAKENRERV